MITLPSVAYGTHARLNLPEFSGEPLAVMEEQHERMTQYIKIHHEAKTTPIPFTWFPYSLMSLEMLYRGFKRQIAVKSRQVYYTTYALALAIDLCLHNRNFYATVHNMTDRDLRSTFHEKVWFMIENSPYIDRQVIHPKSSKEEVHFINGSILRGSRSGRSHNTHFNLVTEASYTAEAYPDKYNEIITGITFGSQHGISFLETSPYGSDNPFIDMVKESRDQEETGHLHARDYWVNFIGWWSKPTNIVSAVDAKAEPITPRWKKYFDKVEQSEGIKLTDQQKAWYVITFRKDVRYDEQRMREESPSTLDEAMMHNADIHVALHAMKDLDADGRILPLNIPRSNRAVVCWDFGSGAARTAFTIWQEVPGSMDAYACVYAYTNDEKVQSLTHYLSHLNSLDYNVSKHVVPHDFDYPNHYARALSDFQAPTLREAFEQAGIRNLDVNRLERLGTARKRDQIVSCLNFLSQCYFCTQNAHQVIEAMKGVQRQVHKPTGTVEDTLSRGPARKHNHLYDTVELMAMYMQSKVNIFSGYSIGQFETQQVDNNLEAFNTLGPDWDGKLY